MLDSAERSEASRRPGVPLPRRASIRILIGAGLVTAGITGAALAVGCSGGGDGESTAVFVRNREVPLGPLSLRVTGSEEVTSPPVPLNTLYAEPGRRVFVVFVNYRGLADLAESDRDRYVESYLSRRATVVDSVGAAHRAVHAMPRPFFTGSYHLSHSRDWVVVFHPVADRRVLHVRFEHPDPEPGGFRHAEVGLR